MARIVRIVVQGVIDCEQREDEEEDQTKTLHTNEPFASWSFRGLLRFSQSKKNPYPFVTRPFYSLFRQNVGNFLNPNPKDGLRTFAEGGRRR